MLYGGQYWSLVFGATGMALLCGSTIGAIAAVSRKAVSEVIMRARHHVVPRHCSCSSLCFYSGVTTFLQSSLLWL